MIILEVKNLPKSTVELTITIPKDVVKKSYEKIINEVVKNAEIRGFRKGKAPREIVEKNINKENLYQEVLEDIIPDAYQEAINKQAISPLVSPNIELVSPKNLSELENCPEIIIKAKTATKPPVKLKNYKNEIRKLMTKSTIWVPGNKKSKEPTIEEILNILLEMGEVELPDLLIERETNRILSQTLEEIKKLGLTLSDYLISTGKTSQTLRQEALQKATKNLKLEFFLDEVAKEEKISISREEIEKAINENKDEEVREELRKRSYVLASILLRQKTIDFLRNL